jgi:hypothetical protein
MKKYSLCVLILLAGTAWTAAQSPAADVLKAAREALGGEKKLAAINTFTATGTLSRTLGQFQMSGDVELICELPDKFVRKETLSIGPAATTSTVGFNGDGAIQASAMAPMPGGGEGGMRVIIGPGGAGPGATPEQRAEGRRLAMAGAKQDFARLALGMFAASFRGSPLEFTHAGTAEAADGTADVLDVTGANNLKARLFIDRKTHLPLMLTWQAPAPRLVTQMGSGRAGRNPGPEGPGPGEPTLVEHRLFYADYRDVDGLKIPFRLSRTIDGKPTEDLTFEKFKLNPKVNAKTFEPSK